MRRTTLVTATLLALSLAPAVQAQRWGYPSDRYNDRYDNRGSNQLVYYSRTIDDAASYIRREFERNNRRPDRGEEHVARELYDLDVAAERFRAVLEHDRNYRSASDEFRVLEDAFFQASNSLRRTERRDYVERGMDQIYDSLQELSRYYGNSYDRRGGRGGYGNDRWDRYNRYERFDRRGRGNDRYNDNYRHK
jgi:hypothetical protein